MRYFASSGGTLVTFVWRSIISVHLSTVRACGGTQGPSGIEKRLDRRVDVRTRRHNLRKEAPLCQQCQVRSSIRIYDLAWRFVYIRRIIG